MTKLLKRIWWRLHRPSDAVIHQEALDLIARTKAHHKAMGWDR